uniref:Uncharacterized protein n=1 Tax=Spongospora subterranea TaxID=70186 RepID=A0A0H5QX91_9EUKA|eukprot:CRZ06231.1 hypothetical protein [Spongospora subterranea]
MLADASADLLALIGYGHKDSIPNMAIDMLPDSGFLQISMEPSRLLPLIDSMNAVKSSTQIKQIPAEQFLTSLKLEPGPPLKMLEAFTKPKKVKKKKRRLKDAVPGSSRPLKREKVAPKDVQ